MTLPRVSPFKYSGPFLGLNTTRPPRELGPMWATDAKNVLLTGGRITPRPPLTAVDSLSDGPRDPVVGMYHWESPLMGQHLLLKTASGRWGRLWSLRNGVAVELATNIPMNGNPASFVQANGKVYIFDGSERMLKTDGTPNGTLLVGITPPTGLTLLPSNASLEQANLPEGTYQWAITFYDEKNDVESNPFYSDEYEFPGEFSRPQMRFKLGPRSMWEGITHWCIYRKNVTLEQPFFLLVSRVPIGQGAFYDPLGTAATPAPLLGSTDTGPWAPVRNGLPPAATMGCIYKDRMFYNDPENPDQLRFSASGRPDHVDPADYQLMSGDEERTVTGMAELSGQLVVLRSRSIWVLSGSIETATNETLATGALPNTSYEEFYRTKSTVGCANKKGPNGAIIAGRPAQLYFPSASGFYSFDGLVERQVSDEIRPTWKEFARRPRAIWAGHYHELSQVVFHAVDPENETIYLVQNMQGSQEPQILCYNYGINRGDGVGGWSYFTLDDSREQPVCIAAPIGHELLQGELQYYSGLLVATDGGELRVLNADAESSTMPSFCYRTGRMVLVDGAEKHIYLIKWLHDQVAANGSGARLRFGFAVRGETDFAKVTADLSKGIYFRQPVRREVSDITLLIEDTGESNVYWDEDFAVTGWALEAELAGHK